MLWVLIRSPRQGASNEYQQETFCEEIRIMLCGLSFFYLKLHRIPRKQTLGLAKARLYSGVVLFSSGLIFFFFFFFFLKNIQFLMHEFSLTFHKEVFVWPALVSSSLQACLLTTFSN